MKVTGLCSTTEVTMEILLIAAFCCVAFAVLVDDGLAFNIAESLKTRESSLSR